MSSICLYISISVLGNLCDCDFKTNKKSFSTKKLKKINKSIQRIVEEINDLTYGTKETLEQINYRDTAKLTVIDYAIEYGFDDIVSALIKKGVTLSKKNRKELKNIKLNI